MFIDARTTPANALRATPRAVTGRTPPNSVIRVNTRGISRRIAGGAIERSFATLDVDGRASARMLPDFRQGCSPWRQGKGQAKEYCSMMTHLQRERTIVIRPGCTELLNQSALRPMLGNDLLGVIRYNLASTHLPGHRWSVGDGSLRRMSLR
jgi:hypothetical protein